MSNWGLEVKKHVKIFEYDFAVEGGALGDITLRGGKIPKGAVVHEGKLLGITLVVGTTSTVALKLLTAADVLAATAEANLDDGDIVDCAAIASTPLLMAADTTLKATVAVAVLTAGKFRVALEYYMLDDV
jgi:hypothetical protein